MNLLSKWVQYAKNSVHCGRHSNIPWHCVLWYATADWWLRWPQWYRALIAPRMASAHGMKYRYIPCPWCLLVRRKPNRVARCPDTCYRREWILARRAQCVASFIATGIRPGDRVVLGGVAHRIRGVRADRITYDEAEKIT